MYVRYVWIMYFFIWRKQKLFISTKLIDWHDILDSHFFFLADKGAEVLKGQMC